MPDQIPMMIMTALSYSKSSWTPLRGNSALFIGKQHELAVSVVSVHWYLNISYECDYNHI